jgi:hypothetical protein
LPATSLSLLCPAAKGKCRFESAVPQCLEATEQGRALGRGSRQAHVLETRLAPGPLQGRKLQVSALVVGTMRGQSRISWANYGLGICPIESARTQGTAVVGQNLPFVAQSLHETSQETDRQVRFLRRPLLSFSN